MSSSGEFRPRIRDLREEISGRLLDDVYEDLLKPAFPPGELDTIDVTREGLAATGSSEVLGLCAVEDDDRPVSVILGYPYLGSKVLLIGYVATRADQRRKHLGETMLGEVRRRWFESGRFTLVVGEVEDPRFYPPAASDPEDRVKFYARHDAEFVVGPYFQPRVRPEENRVYDLLLMVLHADPSALEQPGRKVRSSQLIEFFHEYFAACEGSKTPLGDEETRWLTDWYEEQGTVDLQPIGDYVKFELPQVPGRAKDRGA